MNCDENHLITRCLGWTDVDLGSGGLKIDVETVVKELRRRCYVKVVEAKKVTDCVMYLGLKRIC